MASGPLVEDGAQALAIKPQTESVFLRKLGYLCLALFLVQRPEAFQFVLVNSTLRRTATVQFALDSKREHFHIDPGWFGINDVGQVAPLLSMLI